MIHENSTSNAQEMASRQVAVQEKIHALQRETPGLSYLDAFEACSKLPEMKSVFDAMHIPAALDAPPRDPAQQKAASQFLGKAQAAAHGRGIPFDVAWNAMRDEEPELFRAMQGGSDAAQVPKDQVFAATLSPLQGQDAHRP